MKDTIDTSYTSTTLPIENTIEAKRKELRDIIRKFKYNNYSNRIAGLRPYKREIYYLKFRKKASYAQISALFKELGETYSRTMIARFCQKHFSKNAELEVNPH